MNHAKAIRGNRKPIWRKHTTDMRKRKEDDDGQRSWVCNDATEMEEEYRYEAYTKLGIACQKNHRPRDSSSNLQGDLGNEEWKYFSNFQTGA